VLIFTPEQHYDATVPKKEDGSASAPCPDEAEYEVEFPSLSIEKPAPKKASNIHTHQDE
jgi:hypothetical protein